MRKLTNFSKWANVEVMVQIQTVPALGLASQIYCENKSIFDTSCLDTRREAKTLKIWSWECEAFWRLFWLYLFNFVPRVLLPWNYSSVVTYTNFTYTYIYMKVSLVCKSKTLVSWTICQLENWLNNELQQPSTFLISLLYGKHRIIS